MPSSEQYTAGREGFKRAVIEGKIRVEDMNPAAVRRWIPEGMPAPSLSVLKRQLDEVKEIALETGKRGKDLIREVEKRLAAAPGAAGKIKNALAPFAIGAAGGAETVRRSAEPEDATLY